MELKEIIEMNAVPGIWNELNEMYVVGQTARMIKEKINTLVLGCGNSPFSQEMFDDGFTSITNTDISDVCIDQMKFKYKFTHPSIKWEVMDVKEMKYPDSTFNLVIDKFTLDAVLNENQPFVQVAIMLKEVQRVLKKGGYYVLISYGDFEDRDFHLERDHLGFEIKNFELDNGFVFVCRKTEDADQRCKDNYASVLTKLAESDPCQWS